MYVMYDDLIKKHGMLWLYSSIFWALPQLLPEIITIWFWTRGKKRFYPFLDYEVNIHLLVIDVCDRSAVETSLATLPKAWKDVNILVKSKRIVL